MSEYQYIEFRAVDRPLTDKELAYARKQSTRAEITRWSFTNEYNYGDFHGDTKGLLRHGYDVHLHYANFGCRTAAFRLPDGLPFAKVTWSKYVGTGELTWTPDRSGCGGILTLAPYYESGSLEELWDLDEHMDSMVRLRERLLDADLRALYLMWLAAALDERLDLLESSEPPVPAGLADWVESFNLCCSFWGIDPPTLAAAAEGTTDTPANSSEEEQIEEWTTSLQFKEAKHLLKQFLTEDAARLKARTLAAIRRKATKPVWPTFSLRRSPRELLERSSQLREVERDQQSRRKAAAEKREAKKLQRQRLARLREMSENPRKWLPKIDHLVAARGTVNYELAADLLADLREALGEEAGENLVRTHAAHLVRQYPTLNRLKKSLRLRNLWG
ncbi:hypothetical protein NG895_27665 [Aeoliella sp. ICT_H6.2]|uniref:Uncharacterized protein n=1 Tax=Aeoliella straminimaris TaxID=2954799 RepID=A0A9X2JKY8_9BACT|nr:hypothetical protein [Aeoliella straminimaris]MCO6047699.1 hypothetical protein [Aeoliella straminimaris]